MVFEIQITTKMIEAFQKCAEIRNYKDFFYKYGTSIYYTIDIIKTIHVTDATFFNKPAEKELYFAVEHLRRLFRYLENFDCTEPNAIIKVIYDRDSILLTFCEGIRDSILTGNWDTFYYRYRPIADVIFNKARNQQIADICIEHESNCYPDFTTRDRAQNDPNPVRWSHSHNLKKSRYDPNSTKNSREMMKTQCTTRQTHVQNGCKCSSCTFTASQSKRFFDGTSQQQTSHVSCQDRLCQDNNNDGKRSNPSDPYRSGVSSVNGTRQQEQQNAYSNPKTKVRGCVSPSTPDVINNIDNQSHGSNHRDPPAETSLPYQNSNLRTVGPPLENSNTAKGINYYPQDRQNTSTKGSTTVTSHQSLYQGSYGTMGPSSSTVATRSDQFYSFAPESGQQRSDASPAFRSSSPSDSTASPPVPSHKSHQESHGGFTYKATPQTTDTNQYSSSEKDDHRSVIEVPYTAQDGDSTADHDNYSGNSLNQYYSIVNTTLNEGTLKPAIEKESSFEDGATMVPHEMEEYDQQMEEHNRKSSADGFEMLNSEEEKDDNVSLNLDFLPKNDDESMISQQSCFDLDSLRRPGSPHHEENTLRKNFDDDEEFLEHKKELSVVNRVTDAILNIENLRANQLHTMKAHQIAPPTYHFDAPEPVEEDNTEFDQKLHEIKVKHQEELRKMREERRKKQKNLEDELKNMRRESKKRFRVFMECIILKQRFDEQETQWKEWIKDCRNNIITLHRYFSIFEEVSRIVYGSSKHVDKDVLEDFEREKLMFCKFVMVTFNALEADFEVLKDIEQHYSDAMFLRVLQKCLSDVAHMLLDIEKTTFTLDTDRRTFSMLDEKMSQLKIDLIYSTSMLKQVCREEDSWKYQNVTFPEIPQKLRIEEIN